MGMEARRLQDLGSGLDVVVWGFGFIGCLCFAVFGVGLGGWGQEGQGEGVVGG